MDEPIRILHVLREMEMGGAQKLIMNIYQEIDKTKIQFDFLVSAKGEYDEKIIKNGGRIYYIPYLTKVGPIKYKKELINFFSKHREYKIVHSHIDQVSGIIMQAAEKCDISVRIAHSHNTHNSNNVIGKIYKYYLQSKINKFATDFFACSKEAAKWLFKENAEKAIIINNGIKLEDYKYSEIKRKKIRSELKICDDTFVIGHIGRFSKQKNHEFLIEVFEKYHNKNKNSVLILIGDGSLKTKIQEIIKEKNIEKNVILLGTRNNANEFYSAFDMVVFPSKFEGISLTLIEAQVSGVPIVASQNVDKNTNVSNTIKFINNYNVEDWVNAMNQIDKKRINNIEKIKSKGYDIKDTASFLMDKYIRFYEECKNE